MTRLWRVLAAAAATAACVQPAARSGPIVVATTNSAAVLDPRIGTDFEQYGEGPPLNDGIILKVVPDDTMRGLEPRKGTVDLVVNDIAPDIAWRLREEGRLQVATAPAATTRTWA